MRSAAPRRVVPHPRGPRPYSSAVQLRDLPGAIRSARATSGGYERPPGAIPGVADGGQRGGCHGHGRHRRDQRVPPSRERQRARHLQQHRSQAARPRPAGRSSRTAPTTNAATAVPASTASHCAGVSRYRSNGCSSPGGSSGSSTLGTLSKLGGPAISPQQAREPTTRDVPAARIAPASRPCGLRPARQHPALRRSRRRPCCPGRAGKAESITIHV